MRYDELTERPDRRLPAADDSLTTYAVTVRDSGLRGYGLLILQCHGSVLTGIFATSGHPLIARASAAAARLAQLTGRRLIGLT